MKNKRHDNPLKTIHLPVSLNQGFLCEQDGGSGGAEEDIKGYQILGTKILSERKKNQKAFCQSCGSNQCACSLIGYFPGMF